MRVLEKLLLLILVLLLAAAGVAAIGVCFLSQDAVFFYAEIMLTMLFANRWLVLVGGGVLLLLAVLLFFGVVCARQSNGDKKRGADNVVKVGDGESNVQISTAAVDCIIQQQKQKFPAVVAIESRVIEREAGAEVILKITANADANMQELSNGLQAAVKEQLQDMVGLKVAVVKVMIADVAAGAAN